MADVDALLKKSVLADPAFFTRKVAPNPTDDNLEKKRAKKERRRTLSQWYGMKKVDPRNAEMQHDLEMLRYKRFVADDRVFRRPTKDPLPEFAEIGVIVEDKLVQRENLSKRRRAETMTDEWMKEAHMKDLVSELPSHMEPVAKRKKKSKSKK